MLFFWQALSRWVSEAHFIHNRAAVLLYPFLPVYTHTYIYVQPEVCMKEFCHWTQSSKLQIWEEQQKSQSLSELFHNGNICGFDCVDLAWEELALPCVSGSLMHTKQVTSYLSLFYFFLVVWMGIATLLVLPLHNDLCHCGSKLSYCLFALFL